MIRKIVSLGTIGCFLVFFYSCYTWKKTPLLAVPPEKITKAKISAVQLHSGEVVEFSRHPAAGIQEGAVVGLRLVRNFTLKKADIKAPLNMKTGVGYRIMATDGTVYKTDRIISQDDSSVTFSFYSQASVSLADVDLVWIRQGSDARTYFFIVSIPAVIGILYLLIFLAAGYGD